MGNQQIRLTSAEISALWTTYIQNSATVCFYKHFLLHLEDQDIKPIVEEAMAFSKDILNRIGQIFEAEKFPVPKGFSDKDVDSSAPPLYTDLFALSFVYRAKQMIMINYATNLGKVARQDVNKLFEDCLSKTTAIYKKCLNLMLSKGVYDRPPKMVYPTEVKFVQQETSLLKSWFGEGRQLNALELSELFFTIERNCIGLILLIGLIQVTKDKEIREFLLKGKKLSEKQIEKFNKVLRENEDFPTMPVMMEVTDSTTSPFSERLILFFINATNQIGITTMSNSLILSMRKDLSVHYSLFITEIIKYGVDGLELLIKRGLMEQPPQPISRKDLLSGPK